MSQENVELVLEGLALVQSEGIDAWAPRFAPEIEWDISAHPLPDFPNRGSGRAALAAHIANYFAGWIEYESSVEEAIDAGEDVVVVLHERARMRASDITLERRLPQVWTMRAGSCTRFRVFETKQQALEAVGRAGGPTVEGGP